MKNTLNKNLYLEWHILKNLISNGRKKSIRYEFEKGDSFLTNKMKLLQRRMN